MRLMCSICGGDLISYPKIHFMALTSGKYLDVPAREVRCLVCGKLSYMVAIDGDGVLFKPAFEE